MKKLNELVEAMQESLVKAQNAEKLLDRINGAMPGAWDSDNGEWRRYTDEELLDRWDEEEIRYCYRKVDEFEEWVLKHLD